MNKKIMVIIIFLVIILLLTVTNSSKYSKVLGSVNFMNLKASDVPYTKNNQSTVSGSLDTLYSKVKKRVINHGTLSDSYHPSNCIQPPFEVGDYITMTPSKEEFKLTAEESPTFSYVNLNPQELTQWRVLKKNDCNVEVISDYVTSTKITFYGYLGYKYYVGALNTLASAYENPKYTVGSRSFGYDGQTEVIKDTSYFDGTRTEVPSLVDSGYPYTGVGEERMGGVLGDTLYLKDYLLSRNISAHNAKKFNSTNTTSDYWIASRRYWVISDGSAYSFDLRYNISAMTIATSRYDGTKGFWTNTYYSQYPIRPILVFKTGVTISGGSATEEDPYTLN